MPSTGEVIGTRYRLDSLIDTGGMGAVYRATDIDTGQRVAVKLIRAVVAGDPEVRARFRREIQVLSRVNHEHVARALAADTLEDGTPYLVMELLEGRDLRVECRRRGALPIEEAVDYLVQACRGVAAIHRLGVVHRDLKPHNLFITEVEGRPCVKILDFGVAKCLDTDVSLTASDLTLGTPLYMSTEQLLRPRSVTPRSDLWSLGVILYELLIGFSPFADESPGAVISAVTNDDPVPPRVLRPELPEELERIILSTLEKDPERRPASAEELEQALLPFGRGAGRKIQAQGPVPPDPRTLLQRAAELRRELRRMREGARCSRSGASLQAASSRDTPVRVPGESSQGPGADTGRGSGPRAHCPPSMMPTVVEPAASRAESRRRAQQRLAMMADGGAAVLIILGLVSYGPQVSDLARALPEGAADALVSCTPRIEWLLPIVSVEAQMRGPATRAIGGPPRPRAPGVARPRERRRAPAEREATGLPLVQQASRTDAPPLHL